MQRTRLAVLLALAFVGCIDDPDIIIEANPPDVVVNYDCPCVEGSCEHVVNITEEFYPTETVYVTEEDTTPDVVQEFYGDTADLPVLLWSGIGEPMPKKFTDLTVATELLDGDILALARSGTSYQLDAAAFWLPTNYIGGLITSNDAGDTEHDIAIAPGVARSDDDTANLKRAAILTKQIEATWAVGDDAGGMEAADHPVQADTLYALWLIKRPDTGVVDAMFSLDFSAPTLPTNYTKKRLIAAVMTDASANLFQYTQQGDVFDWGDYFTDVNGVATASTSKSTETLSVPPNCIAKIAGSFLNTTAAAAGGGESLMSIEINGGLAGLHATWISNGPGSGILKSMGKGGGVLVDGSSQIEIYASYPNGAATITVKTLGFTMLTRSEP